MLISDPKKQRGAILERWDGIDGYLCQKLLEDPRFPTMPTYYSYTPMFSEPVNWGDNYGSRISGYFVPQQSGQHIFFIGEEACIHITRGFPGMIFNTTVSGTYCRTTCDTV